MRKMGMCHCQSCIFDLCHSNFPISVCTTTACEEISCMTPRAVSVATLLFFSCFVTCGTHQFTTSTTPLFDPPLVMSTAMGQGRHNLTVPSEVGPSNDGTGQRHRLTAPWPLHASGASHNPGHKLSPCASLPPQPRSHTAACPSPRLVHHGAACPSLTHAHGSSIRRGPAPSTTPRHSADVLQVHNV